MKRIALAILLLLVVAGGGSAYWSTLRSPATASSAFDQFMTASVERGDIQRWVTMTGTLSAVVTVEVGTQLSGQIAELFADFNDEVAKNQPLAQIDTKTYEARLAEAEAASEVALASVSIQRARLHRAEVELRNMEAQRNVLQARVDSARVTLESAQRALDRAVRLEAQGTRAEAELDEVRAVRDRAAAGLREAEAIESVHEIAVEGAKVDMRRAAAELDNALATVPQSKAIERAAEIDLERTTIRSPVDGVVVGRAVDEGQTFAASLAAPVLFTIAGDLKEMEIHARVNEADIGETAIGQRAVFTVDAHPNRRFPATVSGIRKAPEIVQNVVTYTVVLDTSNEELLLLPGMTATLQILVHEAPSVLKLPMAALRFSPSSEFTDREPASGEEGEEVQMATVWRLGGPGGPEPVDVNLGEDDGTHISIREGALAAGDRVIVGEFADPAPRQLLGIRMGF